MKKLALAFILMLSVLMISCPSPETEKPEPSSIDWEPVPEDGKIKAENLTSEHLYSVLINESEARNLIRSTTETESNKNIFPTNYGTWLFFPDESGSRVIDISQDLNVNGASGFYLYDITSNNDDHVIREGVDDYLVVNWNNRSGRLYESYYSVDLIAEKEKGLNLENVVIYDAMQSGGSLSRDFAIFRNEKDVIDYINSNNAEMHGILDFSGYENVGIYNAIVIYKSNTGRITSELKLKNPADYRVGEEKNKEIKGLENIYFVKVPQENNNIEYILKLTPGKGLSNENFFLQFDQGNPRYENGYRRPYLIPLKETPQELLFYVGTLNAPSDSEISDSGDFLFDLEVGGVGNGRENYGTIELIDKNKDELKGDYQLFEIDLKNLSQNSFEMKSVKIDSSCRGYVAFIVTGSPEGAYDLSFSIDGKENIPGVRMVTMSGMDKGFGYSRNSCKSGESTISIREKDNIEYFYLEFDRNFTNKDSYEINITVNQNQGTN